MNTTRNTHEPTTTPGTVPVAGVPLPDKTPDGPRETGTATLLPMFGAEGMTPGSAVVSVWQQNYATGIPECVLTIPARCPTVANAYSRVWEYVQTHFTNLPRSYSLNWGMFNDMVLNVGAPTTNLDPLRDTGLFKISFRYVLHPELLLVCSMFGYAVHATFRTNCVPYAQLGDYIERGITDLPLFQKGG